MISRLTQRLEYLEGSHPHALAPPLLPSPLRDDGYDIADYETLTPVTHARYRTSTRFMRRAPPQLSGSSPNWSLITPPTTPWFSSTTGPAGSPSVTSTCGARPPEVRRPSAHLHRHRDVEWSWDDTAKAYYWHRSFITTDLNFDNPAVLDAVNASCAFWFERGVDACVWTPSRTDRT